MLKTNERQTDNNAILLDILDFAAWSVGGWKFMNGRARRRVKLGGAKGKLVTNVVWVHVGTGLFWSLKSIVYVHMKLLL